MNYLGDSAGGEVKEDRRNIIVVQQSDAAPGKYAVELPGFAFQTYVCRTVNTFRRLHEQHPVFATVLTGPCSGVAQLVPLLRRVNASMWLIYVGAGPSRQHRIQALVSGADVCLSETVETSELASLLHALIRRGKAGQAIADRQPATVSRPAQPRPALPPDVLAAATSDGPLSSWLDGLRQGASSKAGWRMTDGGRRLVDPAGRSMPLTPSERIFMAHMLQAKGRPVHRVAIAAVEAGHTPQEAARSVDVLVSRLRRKAGRHSMVLPVLAVRRWGYMFAPDTPASVHEAAPVAEPAPSPARTHRTAAD